MLKGAPQHFAFRHPRKAEWEARAWLKTADRRLRRAGQVRPRCRVLPQQPSMSAEAIECIVEARAAPTTPCFFV